MTADRVFRLILAIALLGFLCLTFFAVKYGEAGIAAMSGFFVGVIGMGLDVARARS